MKIGLLAPVALPVPPRGYGGTERIVYLLAEGLVARGHEVTLFASNDSSSSAHLRSRSSSLSQLDKAQYARMEAEHVKWALAQGADFDVIHDHTKMNGVLHAAECRAPLLTTLHNDFTPERLEVYLRHPRHSYVAISRSHAARCPALPFAGIVYNGLDPADWPFEAHKSEYLLFLGRICEAKGAHTAIQVAQALGMPLILAGNVTEGDRPYFAERIAPQLTDPLISFVGEVAGTQKRQLLANARCLLFPIAWAEPFGLVMIEAMACGTPVVALACGSAPEVVAHGVTGWLADDFSGLLAGVAAAEKMAPHACRRWVEATFSADAMVGNYLEVYRRVLEGSDHVPFDKAGRMPCSER